MTLRLGATHGNCMSQHRAVGQTGDGMGYFARPTPDCIAKNSAFAGVFYGFDLATSHCGTGDLTGFRGAIKGGRGCPNGARSGNAARLRPTRARPETATYLAVAGETAGFHARLFWTVLCCPLQPVGPLSVFGVLFRVLGKDLEHIRRKLAPVFAGQFLQLVFKPVRETNGTWSTLLHVFKLACSTLCVKSLDDVGHNELHCASIVRWLNTAVDWEKA